MLDHFKKVISEEQATKLHNLATLINEHLFDKYNKIGTDIGYGTQIDPIYGVCNKTWVPSHWFYGGYDINTLLEVDQSNNGNIHPHLDKIQNDDLAYMLDQFADTYELEDKDITLNTIPGELIEEFHQFEEEYQKMVFQFGCILGYKEVDGNTKMFIEVYVNSDEPYYRETYNKIIGEVQLSLDAFMQATNEQVLNLIYHKIEKVK